MKLSECINFLLTNTQNTVFSLFKKELQAYNVTPIQYALLKCLWDEDEQIPTQLAQTLHLDSSTITGILARLEDKGLIVRNYCTTDRRRIIVCLTDAGRILQSPIEALIEHINLQVSANLSAAELTALKGYLQRLESTANTLLK